MKVKLELSLPEEYFEYDDIENLWEWGVRRVNSTLIVDSGAFNIDKPITLEKINDSFSSIIEKKSDNEIFNWIRDVMRACDQYYVENIQHLDGGNFILNHSIIDISLLKDDEVIESDSSSLNDLIFLSADEIIEEEDEVVEEKTNKNLDKQIETIFSLKTLEMLKRNKEVDLEILEDIYSNEERDEQFERDDEWDEWDWWDALAHQKNVNKVFGAQNKYVWKDVLFSFPDTAKIIAKNSWINEDLLYQVLIFGKELRGDEKQSEYIKKLGYRIEELAYANPVFPKLRTKILESGEDFYQFMMKDEKQRDNYYPILLKNPNIPIDVLEELVDNHNYLEAMRHKVYIDSLKNENSEFNIKISLKGIGNELCQDFLKHEDYEEFEKNYDDWDTFCKDKLGLDGYFEFNKAAHLTGLTNEQASIKFEINKKVIFNGNYFDLQKELFEDDFQNNKNVSKNYGKHILSQKENKFLITTRTFENFEVSQNVTTKEFEFHKFGFIVASSDELGYGTDYGDFILGLIYEGEEFYLEYPGGVGIVEQLNKE